MNVRRFVISFVSVLLLAAPLLLNAEGSNRAQKVAVAPRFKTTTSIGKAHIQAKVLETKGTDITLRVTGENRGKKTIESVVMVAVKQQQPGSEFARMAPRPQVLTEEYFALSLRPGESFDRTVTLKAKKAVKSKRHANVFASVQKAKKGRVATASLTPAEPIGSTAAVAQTLD